jgi:predicted transcriptional regulator
MSEETLTVDNVELLLKVASALSSDTRIKILKMIAQEELDVSRIASKIPNRNDPSEPQTEANISAQVKKLEQAKLLVSRYEPGKHGVRKICSTKVKTVIFKL